MKKIISLLLSVIMLLSAIIVSSTTVLGAESWLWPVPSSRQINTYYSGSHDGLDIGGGNNCSIVSTMSGTVVAVIHGDVPGKWIGYGNGVVVQHSNGYYSHYAHMNSTSVSTGQRISQGQEIGKMGSTGNSTGTHLHFAIATSMYGAGGRINNNPNAINYVYAIVPSLSGPTNVNVHCYGKTLKVTWNRVSGANCYDVIVKDPSGNTNWYHSSGLNRSIPVTKTGVYKVDVQSLYRPNGSTNGQIVGAHSSIVTCDIELFGPLNVKVSVVNNKFKITWDAVVGANCYDVIVKDPSGNTNWYHSIGTSKEINVGKSGTYKFDVQSLYRENGSVSGQKVGAHSGEIEYYYTPHTHNWDSCVITKNPTCIETGIKTYNCLECGAARIETIEKTDHIYETITTKATTSYDGSVVTICSVCDDVLNDTTIYYPETIKLSKTSYTYNGKTQTPSVTVKDSKGRTLKKNTDYTVTFAKGRKNVGKYAVKITLKGKYSGSKTLYYTIKPKSTSISKLTAGKKKFTVKWKKQTAQTTGYQIQYSTSSKFKSAKTVTVSKNKTTSKTISKLKAKKKYYVRIRTYKTVKVNGKNTKIYSSWSKAKAVTTKR